MRMHLEGVKNGLPPPAPVAITVEITIAPPLAPASYFEVAVAVITSEDAARKRVAAIRSAAVHTAVARVVTVNKLAAFPIHVRDSASPPLAHSRGRYTQHHQESQH